MITHKQHFGNKLRLLLQFTTFIFVSVYCLFTRCLPFLATSMYLWISVSKRIILIIKKQEKKEGKNLSCKPWKLFEIYYGLLGVILLLYIILAISILIGQEPHAYFENSRDFVDKHDYIQLYLQIIPCAVSSAHLWLNSASTWMILSDAAAWCVCPCIFTSTIKICLHFAQ